jgi:hypothetical protein
MGSTQKGAPRFRTSPAEWVTKWQHRLWPVGLHIFPPPILRRPIRFGQMRTCRHVATAISTDGMAHPGWLASELRGPNKAFQSLHQQLIDVIPTVASLNPFRA